MISFPCQSCGVSISTRFLRTGELAHCRSCGRETPVPATNGGTSLVVYPQTPSGVADFEAQWRSERAGRANAASAATPAKDWRTFPGPLHLCALLLATTVVGQVLAYLTTIPPLLLVPLVVSLPSLFIALHHRHHAGRWAWEDHFRLRLPLRLLPPLLVMTCGWRPVAVAVADLVEAITPPPEGYNAFFDALVTGHPFWFQILTIAVATGIVEEVLFRGYLLSALLRRYSAWRAILLSAVCFGAFHFNPWQGWMAFTAGLGFGWITYRTGSPLAAIFCHVLNNAVAIILISVPAIAIPGLTSAGGDLSPQRLIVVGIGAATFVSGVFWFRRGFACPRSST